MTFALQDLKSAHKHCACHRAEVLASEFCGCFYCCEFFSPSQIERWWEETSGELSKNDDPWTALCPRCGIDAVIGSASGLPVRAVEFLEAMNLHWFGPTSDTGTGD
jgi:hypothetical protein